MLVLKEYYERLKENKFKEATEALYNYSDMLELEGWVNDMMEGGVINYDLGTIFYYNRNPYKGQFGCFNSNKREVYEDFISRVKKDKDFLEVT